MTLPDDALGPTDHLVYHYTSASAAIEHILHSMRMRLGPIRDTNDPWEGRAERVAFSISNDPRTVPTLPAMFHELFLSLMGARVACFCRDIATEDPERAQLFARSSCGWARDRMWAQYADGHRGVCLCFDREKLLEAFRSTLGPKGECLADDVEYGDEQYEQGKPKPNADEAAALGAEEYARRFRTQHARYRYFTKRRDWENEREWRLVYLGRREGRGAVAAAVPAVAPVFVPIREALAGIIVGHRFADAYQPCIKSVCERQGIRAFKMMYSGIVSLSRYDAKPVRAA